MPAAPLPQAYLDGRFLPVAEARISPLDRGFLFGDGVYEVIPAYAGRLFHLDKHLKRLQYSLDAIRLKNPQSEAQWSALLGGLVTQNGGGDQAVYLQVTRGTDVGRDHAFPAAIPATLFAMSSTLPPLPEALKTKGARAMTLPDIRWHRCDIKATSLLANVLLRQQAMEAACNEAVLVRDGYATEGTSSGLFMVEAGVIVTPPKGPELLPSVTRDVVLELARSNGLPAREERIPVASLARAGEIWFVSSMREVYPVTELDGRPVADGRPGPIWKCLFELFQQHKAQLAAT